MKPVVVCLLVVAASGAVLVQADTPSQQQQTAPAADAPLQVNPDAEGTSGDGETSARFLFKKKQRRYNNNRRYPGYDYNYYYDYNNNNNGYDYNNNGYDYNNNNNNNGYDYTSQCRSCGYGAVDYTTARRCCQQGYSNCCLDNDNRSDKAGTCPSVVFGSSSSSFSPCRQDCSRDSDCYGAQKCCSQGCSRTCRNPNGGSSGYEKPGSCPFPGSGGSSYPSYPYYAGGTRATVGGSYCRRDCYSDQQCPGSQKCCESNCSATCVTPQQRYY